MSAGKRWICLLLPLALLLSGCAGTEEPAEEEPLWYAEEPAEEGEEHWFTSFCLAYHRGETLDPLTCSEGVQRETANLLYEPLFSLNGEFEAEGVLCDGYTVSEDGLTYLFHIRPGVRFADGSELTAADAAATLRRAMTTERYAYRLSGLRSVTASGGDGVQVQLYRPNAGLPALLDIPIVKAGTEGNAVPAGTGPYLFLTDGDTACLRANGDWWQGEGQPVEEITLVDAKDADTVQYLFTSREIHAFATDLSGSTTALTGSFDCVEAPSTVMQYLLCNTANPLLADSGVRRALNMGIDRETVAAGYLSGHGSAASFPIAPQSPLYPDHLETGYRAEAYAAAMETALRALEAALPQGEALGTARELRLLVNEEGAEKVAIARYLSETLSAGGLRVIVEALPWAEYMAALEGGKFDLCYAEVRLTADWDLTGLVGAGGALNYGGYRQEATEALLENFRAAPDRVSAASALCAQLERECPILPVCFKSVSLLTHRGTVEGPRPVASNIFLDFTRWRIKLQSGGSGSQP